MQGHSPSFLTGENEQHYSIEKEIQDELIGMCYSLMSDTCTCSYFPLPGSYYKMLIKAQKSGNV